MDVDSFISKIVTNYVLLEVVVVQLLGIVGTAMSIVTTWRNVFQHVLLENTKITWDDVDNVDIHVYIVLNKMSVLTVRKDTSMMATELAKDSVILDSM